MEMLGDDESHLIVFDEKYPLPRVVAAISRACSEKGLDFHLKRKSTFWLTFQAGPFSIKVPRKRKVDQILIEKAVKSGDVKRQGFFSLIPAVPKPSLKEFLKAFLSKLNKPVDYYNTTL